jgi:probable rRNA maturation factor
VDVTVDLAVEDARWESLALNEVVDRAALAALEIAEIGGRAFEISILACDDVRIAELNGSFRDKPKPTNVLSWPAEHLAPETPGARPAMPSLEEEPAFLGDIAIAFETTNREAEEAGLSMLDHVTHLLVHATLHLLGYDHETDADAELMENLEIKALAMMGIGNPYLAND